MRKPDFCLCENKGADQLGNNCDLISAFVFTTRIVQFLYFLNSNFHPPAIFCNCTGGFVSDLVGNPEDHFSYIVAHITLIYPVTTKKTKIHVHFEIDSVEFSLNIQTNM